MNLKNEYLNAVMATPTPADLGGYQLVCSGTVEPWDLLYATKLGELGGPVQWASGCIGAGVTDAGTTTGGAFRVYRKIETARHLGDARNVIPFALTPAELDAMIRKSCGPLRALAAHAAKAATHDDGKPALAHVPTAALEAIAAAQAYGHTKYGDFNNFRKGMEVTRNLSCALRHIYEYLDGSNADHESRLNPLAHAITRLAFVLQNIKDGTVIDDRFKAKATA